MTNAIFTAIRQAAQEGAEHAKSTTLFHDRTGKTRGSIKSEAFRDRGLFSAAGASKWLENGTPAHWIHAHSGALRFQVNGTTFFRRQVFHKGTAERPFMRQAREHAAKTLEYGTEFYVGTAVQRYNART